MAGIFDQDSRSHKPPECLGTRNVVLWRHSHASVLLDIADEPTRVGSQQIIHSRGLESSRNGLRGLLGKCMYEPLANILCYPEQSLIRHAFPIDGSHIVFIWRVPHDVIDGGLVA